MSQENNKKATRKFHSNATYQNNSTTSYYLLPFHFTRLANGKEVIVNEVGDFVIKPQGTVERIVSRQINRLNDSELYGDLLANFIISEQLISPLFEVLASRYKTKKSFLDGFTSLHIFVMTLRCEHSCHYCQVSRVTHDKSRFDISTTHIEKAIDVMMSSPNPNITMEFQGGEPLLVFDKIVYAVKLAQEKAVNSNKSINFVICTNLALINDEILAFCKDNKILISTSIDGPAFIHNRNRKRPGNDSYEFAVQGITRCREVLGEDQVSALMTTTNLSLDYPEEIVETYYQLGFRSIFLRPISPYGFALRSSSKSKYDTDRFLEFYWKAFQRIIEYNQEGIVFREDYASILLRKMLTPFSTRYVDLQSPAGLVTGVVVFNYDGEVYASDEARMLAEMRDKTFCLGHLDKNSYGELFYGDKAKTFINAGVNESLPGCSECAYQSYCGADPVFHYATQGDMVGHRPTSGFCKKNMAIINRLLELMDEKPEMEKIFRTWISRN